MGNVCCTDNDTNYVNSDNAPNQNMLPFSCNFASGTFKDRAYGAILGSLIGNACGAFTDKSKKTFEASQLFNVM